MLNWPKMSKRSGLLVEQLRAVTEEVASLRASLTSETQRASEAEAQLSRQSEGLRDQVRQLHDQIEELARSVSAANDEHRRLDELGDGERLERLEQRDVERETESRNIGLKLIKLEKRIEQQSEDAATTAAMLLERIGTAG